MPEKWAEKAMEIAPRKSGIFELQVMHDDDCPKLRGGECRCDPDVRIIDFDAVNSPIKED